MALADWELSYNGLVIGGYTDYDLTSFEGFEGFDVRSNDQILPSFWGVQAGGDFAQPRTMYLGVHAYPELTTEAQTFETAFLPSPQVSPTDLLPLTFKLPDQVEKRIMCRCRRRVRTRTNGRAGAEMATWLIQLDAPDPRLYASEETSTVANAFVTDSSGLNLSSGSGVDLAMNLTLSSGADLAIDFGGTVGGGGISVLNAGNVDTYPLFLFETTSSMNEWTVINDTTGEEADFVYMLVPGHQIVADMAAVATGSVDPPITLDGDSNYAIWQSPRVPLRLVPGLNFLRFIVTDGTSAGSTATVTYRDAYL